MLQDSILQALVQRSAQFAQQESSVRTVGALPKRIACRVKLTLTLVKVPRFVPCVPQILSRLEQEALCSMIVFAIQATLKMPANIVWHVRPEPSSRRRERENVKAALIEQNPILQAMTARIASVSPDILWTEIRVLHALSGRTRMRRAVMLAPSARTILNHWKGASREMTVCVLPASLVRMQGRVCSAQQEGFRKYQGHRSVNFVQT